MEQNDSKSIWRRIKIYLPGLNAQLAADIQELFRLADRSSTARLKAYDEMIAVLRKKRGCVLESLDGSFKAKPEAAPSALASLGNHPSLKKARPSAKPGHKPAVTEIVSTPQAPEPTPAPVKATKTSKPKRKRAKQTFASKKAEKWARLDPIRTELVITRGQGTAAFRAKIDEIVARLGLDGPSARSSVSGYIGFTVERRNAFVARELSKIADPKQRDQMLGDLAKGLNLSKKVLFAAAKTSPEWKRG